MIDNFGMSRTTGVWLHRSLHKVVEQLLVSIRKDLFCITVKRNPNEYLQIHNTLVDTYKIAIGHHVLDILNRTCSSRNCQKT